MVEAEAAVVAAGGATSIRRTSPPAALHAGGVGYYAGSGFITSTRAARAW